MPPGLLSVLDWIKPAWPLLAFAGALLLPGVRLRLRGWLRDTPSEFAAQMRAAHGAEPDLLDAVFVTVHARVMPRLRPHIDGEYAAVIKGREASIAGLAASVDALRDDLARRDAEREKPITELAITVRELAREVRGVAETMAEIRGDHRDLAKVVGDTREELAAYAGENRRRHTRRADDRSA